MTEEEIRKERNKARELRKTRWWRKKIAKGICYYCGKYVGSNNLTMDHLVPLARGGLSIRANLVPACKECNSKKKDSLAFEWEGFLDQKWR